MSILPRQERERLSGAFSVRASAVSGEFLDQDGTLKRQLALHDGSAVECVLLEDIEGRKTACLSTQVGCPMGCAFCKTGSLGYLRNLEVSEIIDQILFLNQARGKVSNVVFMGMGEGLLNLPNLRKAIAIITHPEGLGMSRRKITISTSGLIEGIRSLAEEGPFVRLAVSLTSALPHKRLELMPVERANPLPELKNALLEYQRATGERVSLEIPLLGDKNCETEDARALILFCRGLFAQINLIPWNPVEGMPFAEPSREKIVKFEKTLREGGLNVSRRMRRGRGISGACGQLGIVPNARPFAP